MLKRLRAAHPILYCILAEVLFLGSLFLSSLVLTVALVAAGADFSGLDEYLLSLVQELVGAGAAWLLLRRTGRQVCRRHERTAARVIHQTRRSVFQRVHRIIHHAASCLLTAICKTPALSTYAMIVPSVSVR